MKKKLLIVSHALELGGAERSLIGLLNAFDFEKYDVDLFLLRHEGELMREIPSAVNLLPEIRAYTVLARPIKRTLKEGHFILSMARLAGKMAAAKYNRIHKYTDSDVALEYSHKYTCPFMPKIQSNEVYDLAISFLTPHYFVDRKVHAKRKIAWIHTDYSRIQVNIASETAMWKNYDYIASISDAVTENFLSVFPMFKEKIILIENILPEEFVKKQANEFLVDKEMNAKGIKILSIGRFCKAKNFDNVPEICQRIRERGMDITWYLIGFGRDEELIKRKIAEANMQEYVKILGKKENPYPYIQACDVYIQPSRYEGKCVTVREAQMLGKPVIITNYETAKEQLESGVEGIIVPMQNQECADQIFDLLNNNCLLEQLSFNCQMRKYSNKEEVKKIYRIVEKSNCVGKR